LETFRKKSRFGDLHEVDLETFRKHVWRPSENWFGDFQEVNL
jgi:hypothetical protein